MIVLEPGSVEGKRVEFIVEGKATSEVPRWVEERWMGVEKKASTVGTGSL